MLKKQYLSLMLLALGLSLLVVYQNCAQVSGDINFSSCGPGQVCEGDPDNLSLNGGVAIASELTIPLYSTTNPNPEPNLNISGTCNRDNFSRVMVRAKIYECNLTGSCTNLKYTASSTCSTFYSIAKYIPPTGLNPVNHKLRLEIYAINQYGQEIFGRNSRLPDRNVRAVQTMKPPTLLNQGSIDWAKPIVTIASDSSFGEIGLTSVRGYCDYSATDSSKNKVYLKFFKPGAPATPFGNLLETQQTQCQPISQVPGDFPPNSNIENRTGWYSASLRIGGVAISIRQSSCIDGAASCSNLDKYLNRLINVKVYQVDRINQQNVDVVTNKNVVFKNTSYELGKSWTVEILNELGKRLNFAQELSLTSVPDVVTNLEWIFDPSNSNYSVPTLDTVDAVTETFSLRKWLFTPYGAGLAISEYIQRATPPSTAFKFRVGSASIQKYADVATNTLNQRIVGLSGATNAPYNIELQNIALKLASRFFTLHDDHTTVDDNNSLNKLLVGLDYSSGCRFLNPGDGAAPQKYCTKVSEYFNAATTGLVALHSKFIGGTTKISEATQNSKSRFAEAVTQMYVNTLMQEIALLDTMGESIVFNRVISKVYDAAYLTGLSDAEKIAIYKSLYPAEMNYQGSSGNFSAYSEAPTAQPNGSIICIPTADRSACN